jgi:hypothetical protein
MAYYVRMKRMQAVLVKLIKPLKGILLPGSVGHQSCTFDVNWKILIEMELVCHVGNYSGLR